MLPSQSSPDPHTENQRRMINLKDEMAETDVRRADIGIYSSRVLIWVKSMWRRITIAMVVSLGAAGLTIPNTVSGATTYLAGTTHIFSPAPLRFVPETDERYVRKRCFGMVWMELQKLRYVHSTLEHVTNPSLSTGISAENVSLVGVLIQSESISTGKYRTKLRAKPVQTEYYRGISNREFTFWLERDHPNRQVEASVSNAKTNSTYEFVAKIVIDEKKKSVDYVLQVLEAIEGSYSKFTELETISALESRLNAEKLKGQVNAAPPQPPAGHAQAKGPSPSQFVRPIRPE
ncbi:hypothetical protein BLNAU_244 [Blattamonas nauphoetae]|uniref:Uncharacterized protein n=1 Tax=Blattamonas nauphoetae TaxID=2049346 RepID=A0ABQ9YMG9_9EUKA|nr:hypothetical protein BLNAU_244 [Blattamonas nauphoetae]